MDFIDRREIDALLGNYERILKQSRFQKGRLRGRDEATDMGQPLPAGP